MTYAIQEPVIRDVAPINGYVCRSVVPLPDGPPLWTMWRAPMP